MTTRAMAHLRALQKMQLNMGFSRLLLLEDTWAIIYESSLFGGRVLVLDVAKVCRCCSGGAGEVTVVGFQF